MPDDPRRFDFFGESFRLNPAADYQCELVDFAEAATGDELNVLEERAAIKRLLRAAVYADDWVPFWTSAKRNKALPHDHLMPVVVAAFSQPIERPTGLPSGSSDGQPATSASSAGDSSSRVIARLEKQGRPDLAVVVAQAQGLVA